MQKDEQTIYKSPEVIVLEMNAQAIICQSGNKSMGWQDLDDGGFEEQ